MDGFAQAQKGKMMSDLISRQAAIDVCRAPHMRNADCSDFEDDEM